MFEKLLPYIRLGLDFLKGALDCLMQMIQLLTAAEESISGIQITPQYN